MYDNTLSLAEFDKELAQAIQGEESRQEDHVELIASENYASPLVMQVQNSVVTRTSVTTPVASLWTWPNVWLSSV